VPLRYAHIIFWDNFQGAAENAWPLYIPAAVGLVVLFADRRLRSHSALAVGFLLASFLAVCPGFYFRSHYFVLTLPAVAMFGGIAVSWAMEKVSGGSALRGRALLPAALYAIALISPITKESKFLFTMAPDRACRHIYGANGFPESIKVAEYIKSHSTPDDRVAVLGSEPQIYFYADRKAAVTYIYMYPLMEEHPFAREMQQEMISQIEDAQPRFVVFVGSPTSWCKTERSDPSLHRWLPRYGRAHYRLAGMIETLAENWVAEYWDDDASGRFPKTEYYISVFERREP
jgi:hypothetical protein